MEIMEKQKKEIEFNERKFKELVLYVADKCSDDPEFGATKFNKILFYADFLAYGLFKEPISGATYFKLPQGPGPKQWIKIRQQMQYAGEIAIQPKRYFNKQQLRVIPLRNADLSVFTAAEISHVDSVINAFCGANASQLSLLSHMEIGWQLANDREDIPYTTVFLSNKSLTEDEQKHGLELAETHEWGI